MGVEVEQHRIDKKGSLSKYPHPSTLGSRIYNVYIQSDFSETQTEVNTDHFSKEENLLKQLTIIQSILSNNLRKNEFLWPFSMPPFMDHNKRKFIYTHFGRPHYKQYLIYLSKKYGVAKQTIAGVHINFSLENNLIKELYLSFKKYFSNIISFQNSLYFKITQNFILNQWFITYLFGASPINERGFFSRLPQSLKHPVRSIRNSEYGYKNKIEDINEANCYVSLKNYINLINKAIKEHKLYSIKEFYGAVRLQKLNNLDYLPQTGINYLEFRSFDNDPFSINLIDYKTLIFFKIFILYLFVKPVKKFNIKARLEKAVKDNNQVALENPDKRTFKFEEGKIIFKELSLMIDKLNFPKKYRKILNFFYQRLLNPFLTPASKMKKKIKNQSLINSGLKIAWSNKKKLKIKENKFLKTEKYPKNLQKLVVKSIQLGIRYQVIYSEKNYQLKLLNKNKIKFISMEQINKYKPEKILKKSFPSLFFDQ